jgi:hypothetical protein
MGRFVIVAYKPKLGKEEALLAAVRRHFRCSRPRTWSPMRRLGDAGGGGHPP